MTILNSLALTSGPAGPLVAAVSAILAVGGAIVSYYADISDVHGVLVKDHWHIVTIEAQ
jgi:hypothetical protein